MKLEKTNDTFLPSFLKKLRDKCKNQEDGKYHLLLISCWAAWPVLYPGINLPHFSHRQRWKTADLTLAVYPEKIYMEKQRICDS